MPIVKQWLRKQLKNNKRKGIIRKNLNPLKPILKIGFLIWNIELFSLYL
jgi:hypothetical protein